MESARSSGAAQCLTAAQHDTPAASLQGMRIAHASQLSSSWLQLMQASAAGVSALLEHSAAGIITEMMLQVASVQVRQTGEQEFGTPFGRSMQCRRS